MRRRGDPGGDVRGTGEGGVDRDVRKAVLLEEAERVRALVLLHPRAVPDLDQWHWRVEPFARESELGFRPGRLDEARVVLQQDAAQLSGELERLHRGPELGEGAVRRLSLMEGHRRP